ncbi:glycogen debranching protein [Limibacter armeniacum]|uniref:alpha-L-rhamnosidase-related protein n=1 Tax=Limibacter armeniacum TaxID=466084 RepID=UPI002FE6A8BF
MISFKPKALVYLSAILLAACGSQTKNSSDALFSSEAFSIYPNKVTQGDFTASAKSGTEMVSNYISPTAEAYDRKVEFKFSLNRKDNELPYGKNHSVIIIPEGGSYQTPIIKFGKHHADQNKVSEGDYLEKNTKVTFRLDMRDVLKAFEEKGYYEDSQGDKVAKSDFQGVFIAGGSAPLNWDFENLSNELKDPDGDGIYEITLVMNAENPDAHTDSSWKLENDISGYPQYKSGMPLQDALYNLTLDEVIKLSEADGTFRTGKKWDGVWTRDVSYAIVLGMGAVEPQRSITSLRKKVKRNRIVQDTGSGGAWPVSTDRTTWSLAAWELYCITGDKQWLKEAFEIIRNTVEDDFKNVMAKDGLVKGETSFLDWRKQEYPRWMDNVGISQTEALGTNVVHYATWNILAKMAKELGEPADQYRKAAVDLKQAINKELWQEDKGFYAMYKYGGNYMITLPRAEALGEALAVLYDVAPRDKQAEIVSNVPNVPYGTPCFYPQIDGIRPYHNNGIWPFVQSFYNMAAAKVENGKALEHGLASVYRASALFLTNKENMVAEDGDFATELNSDYQLWSVAGHLGMVYKVLFGIHYHPDRITFTPAVPKAYDGAKTLTNFKYRNAVLNISLKGFGSKIKSFRLDGKEAKPEFLANLSGEHTIDIELVNNDFSADSKFTLVKNKFALTTPEVTYENGILKWKAIEGAASYHVFKNGEEVEQTEKTSLEVKASGTYAEYTVAAKDQAGYWSFIAEPVKVFLPSVQQLIEAESVVVPTKRKVTGFTGKGAVETSKEANKNLSWTINAPKAGEYFIDFRYANGSGAWNTDNMCALRTLGVNGEAVGTVVMAQRGTDEWSSWAYSNAWAITLKKGKNTVSLNFEDYNENMNVEINTALVDHLRVIKK